MRKLVVFLLFLLAGWLLARWLRSQSFVQQIEETSLGALQARHGMPAASPAKPPPKPDRPPVDDLTRIKGIGPVFQGRLNAAAIRTFAQLAQASPQAVREAAAVAEWQQIEPEEWIARRRLSWPGRTMPEHRSSRPTSRTTPWGMT